MSNCPTPPLWMLLVDICAGRPEAFARDRKCAYPVWMSPWFPKGCRHRLDESRDLPVCATRGAFVGGVWRSA